MKLRVAGEARVKLFLVLMFMKTHYQRKAFSCQAAVVHLVISSESA